MLDADGWALPSLLAQYGSETAYRVTRNGGCVCLEGRRGSQTCLLRSESPAATARQLLACHLPPAWSQPSPALLTQAVLPPPNEKLCKMFA
jgi:hypothetical protein